jgi:type I restriction-modification system DNA methylase subunit
MTKTLDQAKDEISTLCRYFETNRQAFLTPGVKEAHVRQSLIDPFFEALGWDVRNTAMAAPQYREVIPEDSLDVEGHQKAPDYTFRVGTLPKFYAEAKKCGININADPVPAYQLRRYGWSAKVALSILTDFEEFGVYDCTMRPRQSDKASHARIQYFRFDEYPDRWRELWDVYSREAVWDGRFDQYAASKRKRGTSEVDVEFLKEIERWRDALARNIALRNKNLSPDDLNAAVQRTIDRIVFLRMAEDREIEPYERLLKVCERPDIYARFMRDLCRRADEKYNSGLFHFRQENGVSEPPDRITPKLTVDDKVFKPILQGLYFEHGCSYHFRAMPVEILGTVYERFLGKVIRLTAGHQAKIEEKPEVRKAGGVYYTPAYIVDYIVKNTVGKQIEGKSPAQLAGIRGTGVPPVSANPGAASKSHGRDGHATQPLRILDMACGSGSFLLGAYQCLLDHCLKWYIEHKPATHKEAAYKDSRNGQWRLTIEEKKRILTTHIFGVDIDPQAVEVSKLSLLLKVLEDETQETIQLDWLSFKDRALPNLADNIKCGNSLIGPDYFTSTMLPDPDEMKRINPFDWKEAFPEGMKAGGFDCIIGNPPYVIATEDILGTSQVEHLRRFDVAAYKTDLYHLFIEKGICLLRQGGTLGFITPNTWFTLPFAVRLREYVLANARLLELVNFGHRVFADADVHTGLAFLSKERSRKADTVAVKDLPKEFSENLLHAAVSTKVRLAEWMEDPDRKFEIRRSGAIGELVRRITTAFPALSAVARASLGTQAYNSSKHTAEQIRKRVFHAKRRLSKEYLPELAGNDVGRYCYEHRKGTWIKYGPWLHDYRTMDWLTGPRILVREIPGKGIRKILACYLEETFCNYKTILNVSSTEHTTFDMRYLAALLNSRLLSFLYPLVSSKIVAESFPRLSVRDLKRLPIAVPDRSTHWGSTKHDRMVKLVDSMLALHKQLAAAKSEAQKGVIKRQIDATDAEIDRLVYELYGLTEEEIRIVESSG